MKSVKYSILALFILSDLAAFTYENPADYPLMGDWEGKWINPKKGHEKSNPNMAAQLLPINGGSHYRVVILPELYNRSAPYLNIDTPATPERVVVKEGDWSAVFEGREIRGSAKLHGDLTEFELKKIPLNSPTVGLKAPAGAQVLFDGSNYDAWEHGSNKPVTWKIVDNAMQVDPTMHIKENKEKGLGGSIQTKGEFGSMRFHLEFRYPVEATKSGQGRGNSGLILSGIGEIQILNSYTTPNYWDECGSIYKRVPAKVDAAGPPLEWQAYDVTLEMPKEGSDMAIMTVLLNGKILHHKMEIKASSKKTRLNLQDHINPIQFRNIWVLETKS